MRVAIYAQARSGSTSLYMYLKKSLNYKGIPEPYSPHWPSKFTEQEIWEEDNVVAKFLIRDNNIAKKIPLHFDKVIYLTRENDLEGAESLAYATAEDEWHKPYNFTTSKDLFSNDEIRDIRDKRAHHRKYIESQKGFQITYEEIYYKRVGIQKINDYINIKDSKYSKWLDLDKKYRQDYELRTI